MSVAKTLEQITAREFHAYVAVQESGATNMFDVKTVGMLSGLDRPTILGIMANYARLKFMHGPKESEPARDPNKTFGCPSHADASVK